MLIEYDWDYVLKSADENIVTKVDFTYTGTHTESGEKWSYVHYVKMPDPDFNNFIEIEDLDDLKLIEWIDEYFDIHHMEIVIKHNLKFKLYPENYR